MAKELDRIDRRILSILSNEGRITNQELAMRVHLSPRACLDRVRRLEREHVIQRYSAVINQRSVAPFVSVIAEVTLRDQSAQTQRNFERRMRETPEVLTCYLVSGSFDYIVRLACRELEHYRTLTALWIDDASLGVARVVSAPELQTVKEIIGMPAELLKD